MSTWCGGRQMKAYGNVAPERDSGRQQVVVCVASSTMFNI